MIEADIKACWLVQREVYIREEVQALQAFLHLCTGDDDDGDLDDEAAHRATQLDTYKERLKHLNEQYWAHSQLIWRLQGNISNGVVNRAFKSYREDPNWYLCEWLRQDWAGRSGCCGRGCGCCEKDRKTSRGWSLRHCTSACGYCVRRRCDDASESDMRTFLFDIVTYDSVNAQRIPGL